MAFNVHANFEKLKDLFHQLNEVLPENDLNNTITKIRNHEYSIQGKELNPNIFTNYSIDLIDIYRDLKQKQLEKDSENLNIDNVNRVHNSSKSELAEKFKQAERTLVKQVCRVHQEMTLKFPGDMRVWLAAIEQNKVFLRRNSAVQLWTRLLNLHGRAHPKIWSSAAHFRLHWLSGATKRQTARELIKKTRQLGRDLDELRRGQRSNPATSKMKIRRRQEKIVQLEAERGEARRQKEALGKRCFADELNAARKLLLRGISAHPNLPQLYTEALNLELIAATFYAKILEREGLNDDKKEGKASVSASAVLLSQFSRKEIEQADALRRGAVVECMANQILNKFAEDSSALSTTLSLLDCAYERHSYSCSSSSSSTSDGSAQSQLVQRLHTLCTSLRIRLDELEQQEQQKEEEEKKMVADDLLSTAEEKEEKEKNDFLAICRQHKEGHEKFDNVREAFQQMLRCPNPSFTSLDQSNVIGQFARKSRVNLSVRSLPTYRYWLIKGFCAATILEIDREGLQRRLIDPMKSIFNGLISDDDWTRNNIELCQDYAIFMTRINESPPMDALLRRLDAENFQKFSTFRMKLQMFGLAGVIDQNSAL